jgi:murein DD-endopeptidase MepM/ murein hydrolase activator NlpD
MSTPKTVTVKPGDTLTAIAKANNTTVAAIASANNITNPNLIYSGSTLRLPGSTTSTASAAAKPPAKPPARPPAPKPGKPAPPPVDPNQALIDAINKQNADDKARADAAAAQAAADKLQNQHDATAILTDIFTQYGLASLVPQITGFIQQGYSSDAVSVMLAQTPEYKQRFAANDARIRAGLPALSPAEYIATERSYRAVMSAAGLPTGFFDQQSDFTNLLSADVSPTELQNRVTDATDAINKAPAATLDYFRQWYSTGDLVAYALDPNRAAPAIEKNLKAAEAAGLAKGQGFNLGQSDAEHIGSKGMSIDQMGNSLGFVAGELPTVDKLNNIYGGNVTQQDVLSEVFDNNAAAAKKRQALASQERANFAGSGAVSSSSLVNETRT